jgi:hypothetical protein
MFTRAYLRVSTSRARAALEQSPPAHNKVIASEYLENASGATADRAELLHLSRTPASVTCW